jgi:hypothetical protein
MKTLDDVNDECTPSLAQAVKEFHCELHSFGAVVQVGD